MWKHAVEKLPFATRYVPDQYKTEQICDKTILENGGTLESVSDYYENWQMFNKAIGNYPCYPCFWRSFYAGILPQWI